MIDTASHPQVGAPDPDLRTSQIFDDADRQELSLDADLEVGVCFFNDRVYRLGDYVCSGDELLCCEEYGIWVRQGSCRKE